MREVVAAPRSILATPAHLDSRVGAERERQLKHKIMYAYTMRKKSVASLGCVAGPRVTPHPAAVASQEVRLLGQLEHVDGVRRFWGRGDQHLISLLHRPLDRGPLLSLGAGSRCKLSLLHRT